MDRFAGKVWPNLRKPGKPASKAEIEDRFFFVAHRSNSRSVAHSMVIEEIIGFLPGMQVLPNPLLNYTAFDVAEVREKIGKDGYCIIRSLVGQDAISSIRNFWLEEFQKPINRDPVTWTPFLGQ